MSVDRGHGDCDDTWISSGMSLLRVLAISLTVLKLVDVSSREVYAEKAPAGTTPPADG